jgi:hypothetical protein
LDASKPLLEAEMPCQLRLMGLRLSALDNQISEEENITTYFTSPATEEEQQRREQFTCPVCSMVARTALDKNDNHLFNQHIDTCLNKAAVAEIQKDATATTKRSQSVNAGTAKRPRTSEGQATLHAFFKAL